MQRYKILSLVVGADRNIQPRGVTHNQASIPSAQLFTGSNVWSVKDTRKSNIRVNGDTVRCCIEGCCLLPSGDIVLADNGNHNLKKLNDMYQVISVCYMSDKPYGVCYIDNNTAAVTLNSNKLQFVDIRGGMTLTKSVDAGHPCRGVTYLNNQLYVIDNRSVYIYSKDGIKQRILYTHNFDMTSFKNIALSDDGSLIYISNWIRKLTTIDSSGNHLHTFTDSESGEVSGVCVDGEGHVLVSYQGSYKILQFSSDGKKKLGIISGPDCIYWARTLCFDKENTTLVVAGADDNINVLKL
ncbi:uncharacterized protein LOC128554621 [Mercenaria mercenaria]|uniref:uncharacterized protein LOC128554621 n=1 Tax=Mercenaria mercenaria TaxID=6596 RepID=UPI00234EAAE0|nr:uncharacterized protein LOC128554621 [Mercenaria mercenaria]